MNRIFTATDIVRNINALPKNRLYGYLSPKNHGEIQIIRVETPEGPIIIRRRQPGGSWGEEVSMSSQMIWRLANALIVLAIENVSNFQMHNEPRLFQRIF